MLETLKTLSEALNPIFDVFGTVVVLYLVLMGFFHRWGRTQASSVAMEERRKSRKPAISLSSRGGAGDVPWKDPSLISGGLLGLTFVVVASSYVVLIEMVQHGDDLFRDLRRVALSIAYPIVMLSGLIWLFTPWVRRRNLMIALASAAVACFVVPFVLPAGWALVVAIGLLTGVSFCLSWAIGGAVGWGDAQVDRRYPVVDVELTNGTVLQDLWLFEHTATDYRLVDESGREHVLPLTSVLELRTRGSSPDGHEDDAPSSAS